MVSESFIPLFPLIFEVNFNEGVIFLSHYLNILYADFSYLTTA